MIAWYSYNKGTQYYRNQTEQVEANLAYKLSIIQNAKFINNNGTTDDDKNAKYAQYSAKFRRKAKINKGQVLEETWLKCLNGED